MYLYTNSFANGRPRRQCPNAGQGFLCKNLLVVVKYDRLLKIRFQGEMQCMEKKDEKVKHMRYQWLATLAIATLGGPHWSGIIRVNLLNEVANE